MACHRAAAIRRAVHWGITKQLVTAWLLTFPICAAISWSVVKLIRLMS